MAYHFRYASLGNNLHSESHREPNADYFLLFLFRNAAKSKEIIQKPASF